MTSQEQPRRLRLRRKHAETAPLRPEGAQPPVCEKLRAARQAKGLDFFRIERDTKIRTRFLEAIEDGRFDDLPGEIYARGFVRNYASYLGLDADSIEAQWRVETGQPAPVPLAPLIKPAPREVIPQPMPDSIPVPKKPAREIATGKLGGSVEAPAARSASLSAPSLELPKASLPRPSLPSLPAIRRPSLTMPKLVRPSFHLPAFVSRGPVEESADKAESAVAMAHPIGGPVPMTVPGRRLLLQPMHLVLLGMAAVVVVVAGFFAFHWTRVVDYPEVVVSAPSKAVTTLPPGTAQYVLSGMATPGSTVRISWDEREPNTVVASSQGRWEFETPLHTGLNQFDISARNEQTNHNSGEVTVILEVPVPTASPTPKLLVVDSPTDGQTLKSGDVTITGTVVGLVSVMVTPTYVGPPPAPGATVRPSPTPGAPTEVPTIMPTPTPTPTLAEGQTPSPRPTPTSSPSPNASGGPEPVTVIPTVDGKFSASLKLTPGVWRLTAVGSDSDGLTIDPVVVTVTVPTPPLKVTIQIRGGAAWLKIWQDGQVLPGYSKDLPSGTVINITASESVWIRTGSAVKTYVTINGVSYGPLGGARSGSWRITAGGPPVPSQDA